MYTSLLVFLWPDYLSKYWAVGLNFQASTDPLEVIGDVAFAGAGDSVTRNSNKRKVKEKQKAWLSTISGAGELPAVH